MASFTPKPRIGHRAPSFCATAIGGPYPEPTQVTLEQFSGQVVILYFYPRDNTPGCTIQACSLRENWEPIQKRAHLFGVSMDSIARHQKFIDRRQLPFPLISDEEKIVVTAYGVWSRKAPFWKRSFLGVERSTFIIGPDQKIAAILRKVRPSEHAKQLISELDALKA